MRTGFVRKYTVLLLMTVLGYFLEVCVMPYFRIFGVAPNLLYVVIGVVTVAYGKLRTWEQSEQYIDTLCKIGGKIVLANIGEKDYIYRIKDALDAKGISVLVPQNHSFHVLDTYLRSSARLVHFGNGNHGMMFAKGCLYAQDGVDFITDCDKVVPTDLSEFIKEERL